MINIDDKLIKLNKEINRREKLRIHLKHLKQQIKQRRKEKEALATVLGKEENDYLKLQKRNIYNLFASVLGTMDRQLEKEKQEYLHALLMYEGVKKVYSSLVSEKKVLVRSLNGLHAIERKFDQLIAKKEKLLKKAQNYPEELVVVNDRIASFKIQIKEIETTIIKGKTAKRYLHKIILNLKTIEQWGFQGLDLTNNHMKRKTDKVQREIYNANNFLHIYEDQLHDISVHFSVNFNKQIKNLDAFLDRFVDSLITDWVVNNKIENSIHLVNSMMDNITKINGSLEFQKNKVAKFLKEDEEIKAQMILDDINKAKQKNDTPKA